jgi:hypothetical protein
MSNRSHCLSDTPDPFNLEQDAMDREHEGQGNDENDAMVIVNNNEGGEEGVDMEVDNDDGEVDVEAYMNRPVWVLLREDTVYGETSVDGDGYLYGGLVDGLINGEVSVLWDGEPPLPGLEQRTRVNPCDIDGFRGSGNNRVSWTGLAIHQHEDRCENGNKGIDILLVLMMGVHNHPPSISDYRSDLISVDIVDMGDDDLLWWGIVGQAHMAEGLGYKKEGTGTALGQLRGDMTIWGWQIHPDSTGEMETDMRKKSQDIHAEDSILIIANPRITSTIMNEDEINEEVRTLRSENGSTNNAVAKQNRPKIVFVVKTFKKNKLTKTTTCTTKAGLDGVRDVCVGVNQVLFTIPACNAAKDELLATGRPSEPRTVTVEASKKHPWTVELAKKKTKYTIIAKYA